MTRARAIPTVPHAVVRLESHAAPRSLALTWRLATLAGIALRPAHPATALRLNITLDRGCALVRLALLHAPGDETELFTRRVEGAHWAPDPELPLEHLDVPGVLSATLRPDAQGRDRVLYARVRALDALALKGGSSWLEDARVDV